MLFFSCLVVYLLILMVTSNCRRFFLFLFIILVLLVWTFPITADVNLTLLLKYLVVISRFMALVSEEVVCNTTRKGGCCMTNESIKGSLSIGS